MCCNAGALLQRILDDLQPRFAALRVEKDTAEQTAAGLASQVSCHLITSSSLALPVMSVGSDRGKPFPLMPNSILRHLA